MFPVCLERRASGLAAVYLIWRIPGLIELGLFLKLCFELCFERCKAFGKIEIVFLVGEAHVPTMSQDIIQLENGDNFVKIQPSAKGLATVHDRDVLI
jgi:hypothetical protein